MKRVLVVDADPDARESLHALLTLWGHDVVSGPDPVAAGEGPFDAALIDLAVPGAFELPRRLRTLPGMADVHLFATTASLDEDERAARAGFHLVLRKPLPLASLEGLLGRTS